jgi:hypothetical protein
MRYLTLKEALKLHRRITEQSGRRHLVLAVFRRLPRRVARPAVLRLGRVPSFLAARFNGLQEAA